jgi:all-trans-8'-apo-beta-carotenal 15,15'-oxygenase
LGLASFADNLRWKPERGTEVIVVPIDAPRQATRFRVDPFFLWHFANAWDEGETIVADFVRYPDFQSEGWLRDMRHGRRASQPVDGLLTRARISPSLQSVSMETLWSGLPEFPRVDPRHEGARTRALFAAVHSSQDRARESLQDTVLRFDLETGDAATYTFPPHVMVSEPVPAPRSNDDEGHGPLLSLIYDARQDRSGVAVFEAGALADGPVATAWLDQHVPTSFHGCWRADQS